MASENNDRLVEALGEALKTMAFLTVLPVVEDPEPPAEPFAVTMRFTGPVKGTLEIIAGKALGTELAANVMGTDVDDPETQAEGADALKELLNVTCGALLPRLAASEAEVFDITVPEMTAVDDPAGWRAFAARDEVTVVDVEMNPVALKLEIED